MRSFLMKIDVIQCGVDVADQVFINVDKIQYIREHIGYAVNGECGNPNETEYYDCFVVTMDDNTKFVVSNIDNLSMYINTID